MSFVVLARNISTGIGTVARREAPWAAERAPPRHPPREVSPQRFRSVASLASKVATFASGEVRGDVPR